jgi:hypothetical protein
VNVKGTVLQFPKLDSTGPKFRGMRARTNRRLHITAEEGRRRLLAGTLPPWSVVLGSLHFTEFDKPSFPPNLRICGSLTLYNCHTITKLADGLQIDSNADFTDTPLTRLPRRSRVGGILDLTGTKVKGVPRDLVVTGGVIVDEFASDSLRKLASKSPVKWMPPVVNI